MNLRPLCVVWRKSDAWIGAPEDLGTRQSAEPLGWGEESPQPRFEPPCASDTTTQVRVA
jgi:hypothetical protein